MNVKRVLIVCTNSTLPLSSLGTVPSSLCQLGYDSPLEDLLISGNLLTGNLNIGWCNNLVFIDGQKNFFSGDLPNLDGYNSLHIIHLANNQFNGTIFTDSHFALGSSLITAINMQMNQ